MAANGRTCLFAFGIVVLLAGAATARDVELLRIPLGFAKVVQVPGADKEGKFVAIIGNSDIADFTYGPQNRFMFVGKARGTTNVVVLDKTSGDELYNATIVVGGAADVAAKPLVGGAGATAAEPLNAAPVLTGHRVKTYILPEKPNQPMFIRNYDCDPGCAVLPTTSVDRQGPVQVFLEAGGGVAAGAPQLTPVAGTIPNYDVEQHCDRVARVGGTRSETIDRACLDSEQSAYDALKRNWTALPAEMRSHCDQVAASGGSGSYATLQTCIQQEQKAGRDNSMRRFVR